MLSNSETSQYSLLYSTQCKLCLAHGHLTQMTHELSHLPLACVPSALLTLPHAGMTAASSYCMRASNVDSSVLQSSDI
jgi:hypothetical protein